MAANDPGLASTAEEQSRQCLQARNGYDLTKVISVEIVLTAKGALIAVTDEGRGFDVALTFRRFQWQESYFANHGVGFRNLHRAISMVSYENGGRTVLLCFRRSLSAR